MKKSTKLNTVKAFKRILKQLKEENSNRVGILPGATSCFYRNKTHITFLVKSLIQCK